MATTKIEWADRVWNPITGCSPISFGCDHCYARRMATRLAGRCGYPKDKPFKVTFHPDKLEEPLYWKKPNRIFVCSMGDLFHDDVLADWVWHVFRIIGKCSRHIFLILTKRPERLYEFMRHTDPLLNVWLGVSVENQAAADERIPWLLQCPAAVRFVSCEPLLGPVDFGNYFGHHLGCDREEYPCDNCLSIGKLDWVIAGGETGPGARPAHHDWFRSLRDQCQATSVPFFFKGWGEWASYSGSGIGILSQEARRINDCGLDITNCPELWCDDLNMTDDYVYKVGKKHSRRFSTVESGTNSRR